MQNAFIVWFKIFRCITAKGMTILVVATNIDDLVQPKIVCQLQIKFLLIADRQITSSFKLLRNKNHTFLLAQCKRYLSCRNANYLKSSSLHSSFCTLLFNLLLLSSYFKNTFIFSLHLLQKVHLFSNLQHSLFLHLHSALSFSFLSFNYLILLIESSAVIFC